LLTIPQRFGTSLVIVIGIAGVAGVLVAMLAMSEGFRHTLASTGRPDRVIMLRAGSDSELASGVPRTQATLLANLPGVARDAGRRPLASAEMVVMVDLPRKGETSPKQRALPRRAAPTAFAIREELQLVEGRRFERGVREVIVGRKAAQQFAGLNVGSRIGFRDSDWTVVSIFTSGGDVHESEIWPTPRWPPCQPSAARNFSRSRPSSPTAQTPASPPSRTPSVAIDVSRSGCCGSPSITPVRPSCSRTS
jgi:putative ABC transport system permease protein